MSERPTPTPEEHSARHAAEVARHKQNKNRQRAVTAAAIVAAAGPGGGAEKAGELIGRASLPSTETTALDQAETAGSPHLETTEVAAGLEDRATAAEAAEAAPAPTLARDGYFEMPHPTEAETVVQVSIPTPEAEVPTEEPDYTEPTPVSGGIAPAENSDTSGGVSPE